MSGWSNPPVVETVQAQRTVNVHPLDHARLTAYVHLMFDHMDREHSTMPAVMAFLREKRREMINLIIPSREVPANYVRLVTGEVSFIELKASTFYVGLEDRKKFPNDIHTLKRVLAEAI